MQSTTPPWLDPERQPFYQLLGRATAYWLVFAAMVLAAASFDESRIGLMHGLVQVLVYLAVFVWPFVLFAALVYSVSAIVCRPRRRVDGRRHYPDSATVARRTWTVGALAAALALVAGSVLIPDFPLLLTGLLGLR